jgi:hypothetical protein
MRKCGKLNLEMMEDVKVDKLEQNIKLTRKMCCSKSAFCNDMFLEDFLNKKMLRLKVREELQIKKCFYQIVDH